MMVEERNGNIYSQRVANQIQVKLNNCPFTPHNFKLAYDLEGYENEKSNKLSELNKVQTRLNMENYNSRMFFEAMKLKSLSRLTRDAKKVSNEKAGSAQMQPTGKFYHLNFEPMRIEDFKELDENKIDDDDDDDDDSIRIPLKHKINAVGDRLNNNKFNENNNVMKYSNNFFISNNSPVIPSLVIRPSLPGNEEKPLVLASVSASKFPKRGNSRKLPNIPCHIPVNKLSSTIPDLIATTKTPSLAEEIIAVYNRDKKNHISEDHDYIFPQCFHLDDSLISRNEDLGQFTLEDLGLPEMIDPIKKYSDLYLKETYVKSIVCFLSTNSADFECTSFRKEPIKLEENSEQNTPSEVDAASVVGPSSPSPSKEPDMPCDLSGVGSPCSNLQRSRKSSRSNEPGLDEFKRDSSIVSRTSDNQSLCSHESSSEAGMSSFPPGFPDIELYLEESDATHRGCHKFLPRHSEEIAVEIGDSLFVEKEHDDLWCEGINLRTKKRGIFPTAYATDLSLLGNVKYKYFVSFLGSIEVGQHTGHEVLYKAIKKLAASHIKSQNVSTTLSCLEIEESGIKISERKKKTPTSRILSTIGKLSLLKNMQENEHVFLLKNITFCGILPSSDKYFGFITKHPICMKFACHVFQAPISGRSIVEAIGNSLSKFHQEFLSVAYPVEDIYFE